MKRIMLICGLFCSMLWGAQAQNLLQQIQDGIAQRQEWPADELDHLIAHQKSEGPTFQKVSLLTTSSSRQTAHLNQYVKEAYQLSLDHRALKHLIEDTPDNIQLAIPLNATQNIELELTRVQIQHSSFQITTGSGRNQSLNSSGIFYQGVVKNFSGTTVAASFFNDRLRILIHDPNDFYVLGPLSDSKEDYVLYAEQDLREEEAPWTCDTPDTPLPDTHESMHRALPPKSAHCVKVYFETEFQYYLVRGSDVLSVVDHVLGVFNEVNIAYRNIGVKMEISEIFVWDVQDPYSDDAEEDNTGDILSSFYSNRTTYNGDLAHLLTTRPMGGLANSIGGICFNLPTFSAHCLSGGLSANNVSGLPTTSSTFVRVAHEMGHILGTRHTHACVWGGSQIDDCGNIWATTNGNDDDGDDTIDELDEAEGSGCYDPMNPVMPSTSNGRGTIMSYCHLVSDRDIANGFADGPANAILSTVNLAICLGQDCSCEDFENRTVNGSPISGGVYAADNSVNSSGDATGDNVVIFRAGNYIELNPGFEANELFIAEVIDTLCDEFESLIQPADQRQLQSSATKQANTMRLFPNPAIDQINIQYDLEVSMEVEIHLLNQYGQVLRQILRKQEQEKGPQQLKVDIEGLPNSVYYIVLKTAQRTEMKPFVVSNL